MGSENDNYLFAYYSKTADGQALNLTLNIENEMPLLEDEQGNTWNIFGEAIAGPLLAQKLKKTESYIGFWFYWAAFYPQIKIFESDSE